MKYIKNFENIWSVYNTNSEYELDTLISKEKIYSIFEKYSLSCDPKQNKNLNNVEYDDSEQTIKCSFTTYTLDGKVDRNILKTLSKIQNEIDADDYTFGNYSRYGSYLVTFIYTKETLKNLEIKKNIDKYNL